MAATLSKILSDAGAGFVLVRPPGEQYRNQRGELVTATGKEAKGAGWQRTPKTLAEAHAHARRGGNVGLLGGHGGLILIDLDKDRDAGLAAWPELAGTLEIYRDTAAERGKFIVRVVGELPPSVKDHDSGTEILAAGSQGVIVGVHNSGARIQFRGDRIIDVDAARVAAFWRKRTGTDIGHAGHQHDDAGPADAEAVQRSQALVERVLELAGVKLPGWKVYNGAGRKVVLDTCPFNPSDDPHVEDGSAAVVIGADGRIGATCHHARCQARIQKHEGGGWSMLKDVAGYKPDPPPPRIDPAELDAMRAIMKTINPDDFMIGRTAPTLRIQNAALAVLRIAQLTGRYTDLALGVRRVAEISGTSKSTAARVLPLLTGWFIVASEGSAEDEQGRPLRWSIAPSILAAAREKIEVDQLCQNGTVVDLIVDPTTADNNVSHFGTVDLRTAFMGHDAFIARQLPMKESEFKAKAAEREAEIAQARADLPDLVAEWSALCDDLLAMGIETKDLPRKPKVPRPVQRRRYIRRLRATVASPGPAVLVLVDLLNENGPMRRQELAEAAQVPRRSIYRTLSAGVEVGVLEYSGGIVSLADDWQKRLAQETPKMPTAGVTLQRQIDNVGARLGWLKTQRARAANAAERAALDKQIARATAKRQKLMARQAGRDVDGAVAGASLTNTRFNGDSLQTTAQVLASKKPRRRMTEHERFIRDRFGEEYAEEAEARWGRFNAQMNTTHGAGWWVPMGADGILVEYAAWEAEGYGVQL